MNNLQKNILYTLLKTNGCSRKNLADYLHVSRAAITQNTNILLENNFIQDLYKNESNKIGRKEEIIAINKNAFCTYGIDIDNDCIQIIKLDAKSNIIFEKKYHKINEIFEYFKITEKTPIFSIVLSKKGFYSIDILSEEEKDLYNYLCEKFTNVYFLNNIASLAYCYKYFHSDDSNFILIKYGPGLGSACFIDNKLLANKTSPTYEIGKMIYDKDGKFVEDLIKYTAFSSKNEDAVSKIKGNKKIRNNVMSYLSLCVININTCLQLDKIIISGDLFKEDQYFDELLNSIKQINSKFNLKKLVRIDDYGEISKIKSGIAAKYLFLTNK